MLNWRAILLLSLYVIFQPKIAFSYYLPKFEDESDPIPLRLLRESVHEFRVLIFPHLGTYATPQGREAKTSSVRIVSAGCNRYRAKLDSHSSEWKKDGELLHVEKDFTLTTATSGPFYFECPNGFQVKRDAKQKSYSYKGNFVSRVNGKSVQIINLISPEEYLRGVVPAEVSPNWPIDLLKAQAIAARTYAWWSVLQNRSKDPNRSYDVDDTVQYQVYIGTGSETDLSNQAISDTQNLVIRHNGEIIKAYFSSDSGGYTESSLDPFKENLPYCQSKPELYALDSFETQWPETKLSLSKISALLRAQGIISATTQIQSLEIHAADRNESGRVKQVTITSTKGKKQFVDGARFRLALKLRSTMFNVSPEKIKTSKGTVSGISFSGRGYGHGVGMSQKGALQYVQGMGWNFEQVLRFYYSDITLSE